jgi:hypothetical protein
MARGTTLLDPTLDLCGATYASESNRTTRRQTAVTKVGSAYQFLSSESVRYRSEAAAFSAFQELKKNYENCVRDKGGTENGVFVGYEFQTLPNGGSAILSDPSRILVRATLGTGASARQLFAVYQFSGPYFSGLYVVKSGAKPIEDSEVTRWIDVASIFAQRLNLMKD